MMRKNPLAETGLVAGPAAESSLARAPTVASRLGRLGCKPKAVVASGCLLLLMTLVACRGGAGERQGGEITAAIQPSRMMASSPELVEIGRQTYEKHCQACHGADGDGQGEAAYLLYPRPRDLTRGQFRLVSTWEGIATDEDLYRTISRGMPGSAMPSWAHLPEETRWALVHYVKSFSRISLEVSASEEPAKLYGVGKGVVQVPPAPPFDDAGQERARELYAQGCAPCHGVTGRGDGRKEQFDSQGLPTRPRDLTVGVFKGLPEPEEVYRRIVAGLPGSPMPTNSYLHGDDGWYLTQFVLAMSSPEQRQAMEMKRFRIVARRVEQLPTHPDSGIWRSVEAVRPHLMPLWWRPERSEELAVKAVHDGQEVALLLVWSDPTYDHAIIRPQDFRDAAAVQFSTDPDPPFFAMGERGGRVNIWMWKSERQADLEPVYQDLDKVYPYIGIDSYPNFLRSPLEQPTRQALTLESDPTYVTAWGVGNVVSDPTRQSAVEDLTSEGFGTLRARNGGSPAVRSTGIYSTGSYRVLFSRRLRGSDRHAVSLRVGDRASLAFAVWDGSAGDRDGKKSVTIWQELVIEP
jgi:mono/diheme cytochrome c family protein